MEFRPYHYQAYALDFILSHPVACLLLDMGMGKTVISLTAIEKLLFDYFTVEKVLVIAPKKPAKETWLVESKKWEHLSHLKLSMVMGSPKERELALEDSGDIFVTNRENVVWLVDHYAAKKQEWPFDMVVIDELSSFKSSSSQRFRALKKVRKYISRIVGLTGTPAPNGLLDLWPQMFLMDGGEALGRTVTGFREEYFLPDKRNRNTVFSWKPKEGAENEIYQRLESFCVSMKSGDFLDLPPLLFLNRVIPLSEKSQKIYQQMVKDTLLPFADGIVDGSTAATLVGKLLQIASGAVYDENQKVRLIHEEKLEALDTLLEEANGQPVLLFYSFRHELERIKARYSYGVDIKEEGSISAWNHGDVQLLLAHPASAGHGLNLQGGGHIAIWFGLPMSLELYQQANKRLHRPGQKETVLIHHLLMEGTYEEKVLTHILAPKEARQEALLSALEVDFQAIRRTMEDENVKY